MTDVAIAQADLPDSREAGRSLGRQISAGLRKAPVDALVLFASSRYDYAALLDGVHEHCQPHILIGCSSAGEFTSAVQSEGSACALGLHAPDMQFAAGIGRGLGTDRVAAAKQLLSAFHGLTTHDYRYRTALILTDALAGYADELVEQLTVQTAGRYQFFGGGAGDDAHFERTHVFHGDEVATDAVVGLEILSNKPLGIGAAHGWQPASAGLRVTESEGLRLVSLNAIPAAEVLSEHAQTTGQPLDAAQPLPFFLHNVLGIETGAGHRLRVPLAIQPDESVICAADMPTGATLHIMSIAKEASAEAAVRATRAALHQLNGHEPKVALFFDCVATRLRMGRDFSFALNAVQETLGPAAYAGFNTYGQIVRAEGQFSGFHNCTAVVCIIPE